MFVRCAEAEDEFRPQGRQEAVMNPQHPTRRNEDMEEGRSIARMARFGIGVAAIAVIGAIATATPVRYESAPLPAVAAASAGDAPAERAWRTHLESGAPDAMRDDEQQPPTF
jgi:hypothetical protein